MKKILVIITVCCSFCFVSCSEKSPEEVTQEFIVSMYTGNFENAKTLSCPKTTKIIEVVEKQISKSKLQKVKTNQVSVENMKCIEETDSTAVCKCSVVINRNRADNQNITETHHLIKHEGKWLIKLNE